MPPIPTIDSGPVFPWMLHPDQLVALYDLWLGQDAGREVPLWRPLDRELMAPWLGSLFILRFPDPASDEIRPGGVGRKIMQRLGFDPSTIAHDAQNPNRLFMERSYLEARQERRPVYSEREFVRPNAVPVPYTRLALPYENHSGVIDRLLCGIYFLTPGTRTDTKSILLERFTPDLLPTRPEAAVAR